MIVSVIMVNVEDYSAWREVFDRNKALRADYGCQAERVLQDLEDPNKITIMLEWDSANAARVFAQSDDLRQAMQESGVVDQPLGFVLRDTG